MNKLFEDFKIILANNEINDISEKYMLELSKFFEKFNSEIALIVSLSEQKNISRRDLLSLVDRLEGDYSDVIEDRFYAIYLIFSGKRFNLASKIIYIAGYGKSFVEYDIFCFEEKRYTIIDRFRSIWKWLN